MPRGTQADSEWLCMSRGINLVGLNRRESGATGDSTPGSCALDRASRYRCDPARLIGGESPRSCLSRATCTPRHRASSGFPALIRPTHAGAPGQPSTVVVSAARSEIAPLHDGPSRHRGAGASTAMGCQRPCKQYVQRQGSWPLTRARKTSAASMTTGCGSGICSVVRAAAKRARL